MSSRCRRRVHSLTALGRVHAGPTPQSLVADLERRARHSGSLALAVGILLAGVLGLFAPLRCAREAGIIFLKALPGDSTVGTLIFL